MNSSYVAISGNIGSGKTTLCKYLEENLENSSIIYEKYEENEHLTNFYEFLKKNGLTYNPYSYKTQLKFLQGRIKQEEEIMKDKSTNALQVQTFVVDRSIHEDALVFALSHFKSGLMSAEEHNQYCEYFAKGTETIRLPNLVVHLKISPKKLHERIQERGREMEKDVSEDYLSNLQELYEGYITYMREKGVKIIEISTEDREQYPFVLQQIRNLSRNESA